MGRLAELVDQVEAKVTDSTDREISTESEKCWINALRNLDKIAYVRFASVPQLQDEQAFFNELKNLMRHKVP